MLGTRHLGRTPCNASGVCIGSAGTCQKEDRGTGIKTPTSIGMTCGGRRRRSFTARSLCGMIIAPTSLQPVCQVTQEAIAAGSTSPISNPPPAAEPSSISASSDVYAYSPIGP